MKSKILSRKEGYCPRCNEPIYSLKLIRIGKRDYIYAEHFDGVRKTLHYIAPASRYKYVLNNLFVFKWLVKNGYIPIEVYIESYKKVLDALSKDDLIDFSQIKDEIVKIIRKKAKGLDFLKGL